MTLGRKVDVIETIVEATISDTGKYVLRFAARVLCALKLGVAVVSFVGR